MHKKSARVLKKKVKMSSMSAAPKYENCKGENSKSKKVHSDLHISSYRGNEIKVRNLLANGFDVNAEDENGETALHVATEEGHFQIVELLLNYNADVNCTSLRMIRPLHIAANNGSEECFNLLLKFGADINVKNYDGETPLHIAAQNGYIQFVETLLSCGSNVNCLDKRKDTPLHLAVYFKHIEIAQLLLEHGAEVNATNLHAETPLHMANDKESVTLLLDYGADINIMNNQKKTVIMIYSDIFTFNDVHKTLHAHMKKLKKIGFKVSSQNNLCFYKWKEVYKEGYKKYGTSFAKLDDILDQNYSKEINEMKSIKISNYTSLYNVIFKAPNDIALLVANDTLAEYWRSNKFLKQFPSYGYLLKLQFKRGLLRNKLLKLAKESLQILTELNLPDIISEEIFKYLNDNELNNVIEAKSITIVNQKNVNK